MTYGMQMRMRQFPWVLISLIVLIGCTPAATPQSTESPLQVSLTADKVTVKVTRGENTARELPQDERLNIEVEDRISLDEGGHGDLQIRDQMEVELLRTTEIRLAEAIQEAGGPILVTLDQIFGHTRILVNEGARARVTLQTDYATLTTLEPGTEFLVCHAPGVLTCMVTLRGEVEVKALNNKVIVPGGSATYILPDQPPQPAICARIEEVMQWLATKRGTEDVPDLGVGVAGWPQEPCSALAAESPTEEMAPLPQSIGMVRIDSGLYEVGSANPDEFHMPLQEKTLPEFWIDKYEVTNALYQQYLDGSGQLQPAVWPGEESHPVRGVSWDQAVAFCTWANKRLPSEAEWEVAARGPGSSPPLYPWGDDPSAGGEVGDLPRSSTYEVGSVPFNKSAFGVYDTAGNVWEWVGEPYDRVAEGNQILRGGRYGFIRDLAYRQPANPNSERFVPLTGFRCAADQVEGE